MSENLNILEGDLGRQFAPVDRLSVNNQGGGESRWVVADFLETNSLTAMENGLYLAVEEDCDCFDEVEVDVSEDLDDADDDTKATKKITGKDPNLDPNNDYAAGLDENGNLTKEMIPAAIHIVVPPRKLKYEDGETIDFTGIHVYLMNGNNQRYTDEDYPTGEIPFDELMFPETIADESQASGQSRSSDILPDGMESFSPISSCSFKTDKGIVTSTVKVLDGRGTIYKTSHSLSSITYIRATDDPDAVCIVEDKYNSITGEYIETEEIKVSSSPNTYTHDGKKVYYDTTQLSSIGSVVESLPIYSWDNIDRGYIAWTLIYGEIVSGGQEIPVQWVRFDGEILEDTFTIEVGEGGEPSPPQPDPWAGSADVSWGGHHYNLNRRIVPQVHYANGYCWQEGTSEYTVEQAASMGWLILIR
jgi:hypothetical protein